MEPDPGTQEKNEMASPVVERPSSLPGHDSMVTVRLSEPIGLTVNTNIPPSIMPSRKSILGPKHTSSPISAAAPSKLGGQALKSLDNDDDMLLSAAVKNPKDLLEELEDSAADDAAKEESKSQHPASPSGDSVDENEEFEEEEVNWDKLQKSEDEQAQSDDNSTAMLLARLEEENNKLASNPKGVKVKVVQQRETRRPRPPSMAQLRDMVHGPTPVALRYSILPPPPMTDMEFYVALVQDYQQTAARLPTLLSRKIRKGIPPPLRGVVWQSMAGAQDTLLLEQFERLSGESSPYEGIIGKDLNRSFPGVEMFREPDGDGQRMLARVLKCFSLYDQKIGYCQGLAFLVGPLLMHMPDSQAFCVLVRLMEHYDLRACFLPDLSGLHVRIYQFRELLRQNLPNLSSHLDDLQVDPAYVSQWFLSFFAVTCPLPMLFRIYDVIFAEGSSETIMRVALSLMRKNESRILACTELEDVMQLLLSRGLWDCYHYNADEFVDDFVGLSLIVSREKLAQLEQNYREAKVATANAARTSDVTTAASRFLGRLWTTTNSGGSRSALGSLSPSFITPSRPLSMLRRSTSKQSLASTLNSMETSSTSVLSTSSTDASTTVSRASSNTDDASIRDSTPTISKQYPPGGGGGTSASENKALHSQIEDLLTALSDLQRNHALLATELQKEREDREEERRAVKSLLQGLKKPDGEAEGASDALTTLIEGVEERFGGDGDSSQATDLETKQQLRDELARAKEHLMIEVSKSQDLNRQIEDISQETQNLKDQLRETHTHIRSVHQDKQRLEKQVHSMRVRASADAQSQNTGENSGWLSTAANALGAGTGGGGPSGGLRELKLGRSKSTPTSRGSNLLRTKTEPVGAAPPPHEQEDLLLQLAQAKTAEAIARQEADEYKQKLEILKKTVGVTAADAPAANTAAGGAMGVLGRLTGAVAEAGNGGGAKSAAAAPATQSTAPATSNGGGGGGGGGGFWGWRR